MNKILLENNYEKYKSNAHLLYDSIDNKAEIERIVLKLNETFDKKQ